MVQNMRRATVEVKWPQQFSHPACDRRNVGVRCPSRDMHAPADLEALDLHFSDQVQVINFKDSSTVRGHLNNDTMYRTQHL
jgi:hypothetical protein